MKRVACRLINLSSIYYDNCDNDREELSDLVLRNRKERNN